MPDTPPPDPKPLLPVQPKSHPGAGGWTPKKATPIFVAVFLGVTGAMVPVLMVPEPRWNVVLASALGGAATALGAYFGMRSAGSRQP